MKYTIVFILFSTPQFSVLLDAQIFLNGSFEDNSSVNCGINLTNDNFNLEVDHTFAFGVKDEIDVLTEECGYGPASDGNFYLALSSNVSTDQISLELDKVIPKGTIFSFNFDQKSGITNSTTSGVGIGISDLPNNFGQLVYSSVPIDDNWKSHHVEFEAPFDAKYITVRTNSAFNSWVLIDNFQTTCPQNFSLGNDTIVCDISELIISTSYLFDTYLWDDSSTFQTKQVTDAGLHWVEVGINNCILRDSIFIQEYPSKCNCKIFTPNVFSPSSFGINDEFKIQSNCPFSDFEIIIFDRWGNAVFRNINPSSSWTGININKELESGVYIFSIKYQFEYETVPNYIQGDVLLIK